MKSEAFYSGLHLNVFSLEGLGFGCYGGAVSVAVVRSGVERWRSWKAFKRHSKMGKQEHSNVKTI